MKKIWLNNDIFKEIKEVSDNKNDENSNNIKEIFDVVFKFMCYFSCLFLFGFKMIDFCCDDNVVQEFPTLQFFPYIIMGLSMMLICFLLIYGCSIICCLNEKSFNKIYKEILKFIIGGFVIFFAFFELLCMLELSNDEICKKLVCFFYKSSSIITTLLCILIIISIL